jgi:hypothetical protein
MCDAQLSTHPDASGDTPGVSSKLIRRIQQFYELNPGALCRPRDLRPIVGGTEVDILSACDFLVKTGYLHTRTGMPSYWRRKR